MGAQSYDELWGAKSTKPAHACFHLGHLLLNQPPKEEPETPTDAEPVAPADVKPPSEAGAPKKKKQRRGPK